MSSKVSDFRTACINGDVKTLEQLISEGFIPKARHLGMPSICLVLSGGADERSMALMTRMLLEAGADPEEQDMDGHSAIFFALGLGLASPALLLLTKTEMSDLNKEALLICAENAISKSEIMSHLVHAEISRRERLFLEGEATEGKDGRRGRI